MNYYISDLHLGHKNCLTFDKRPFKDIEEMDKYIIENWNKVITDNDDVYILGDISWYNVEKTIEIYSQLKGKKHLIIGNHDGKLIKSKDIRKLFVEICDYKEIYDKQEKDNRLVILSHYPIPCFKNHYHGTYHLYGHVHDSKESAIVLKMKRDLEVGLNSPCNMYNVGCMIKYINYTPRTLEYIINNFDMIYNTEEMIYT